MNSEDGNCSAYRNVGKLQCARRFIPEPNLYILCHGSRCLLTAGKHVNNPRAITRQLLGKRVPAATYMHTTVEVFLDYINGNSVFYAVRAEMYNQGQSSTVVDSWD
jgi:hypothetical protein